MAVVKLVDIYNPLVFSQLAQEAQIEVNKFISSGIAMPSPLIQNMIAQGGNIFQLTNYNPLGTPAPNLSDDNDAAFSTPNKIATTIQNGRLITQNQSWSAMNIARELALADPVMAITNRIGAYWATILQTELISSLDGIVADNIANDASDMGITVGSDAVGVPTAAEKISAENVLTAKQTAGDHAMMLFTHIGMHSAIYTTLQLQNLIAFIPNSRGEVNIPTYLGYTVVVDDAFPAVAGANRILYTVYLFGQDVFGMASGRVDHPSEFFRVPSAGIGGGQDLLWSRRNDAIHPFGFDFTSAAVAGQSADYAELATAANWNRIWDRKNVPIAFLQVNN